MPKNEIKFIFAPHKKLAVILLFVILFAAVFETLGLGMVLPMLQTIIQPDDNSFFAIQVKKVFKNNDLQLNIVCILLVLMIGLKSIFTMLRHYLSSLFINKMRLHWTTEIIKSYLSTNYTDLIKYRKGVLLNNIVYEPTHASKAVRDIIDLVANSAIALCIIGLLFIVNWKMTICVGLLSTFAILTMWNVSKKYSLNVGKRKIRLNQRITQTVTEAIIGIRQIKIFSIEEKIRNQLTKFITDLLKVIVSFQVVRALPVVLSEFVVVLMVVSIIMYYKIFTTIELASVMPTIGLFIICSIRFFMNLSKYFSQRMSIASYWPSIMLIKGMIDENLKDKKNKKENEKIKFNEMIKLQNIKYKFENGKILFNNLNIDIPKNKITAIAGLSGSGKSTICDLICGFNMPNKGNIYIDQNTLNDIDINQWRKMIGYVSQENYLFPETIYENIKIGSINGFDENYLENVISMAMVKEFLNEIPNGINAKIEDGVNLSGGQKQRIAIARAFIRNPELIIFDEATSSLDGKTENEILKQIKMLAKEKAILFITHRLNTLKIADNIYFLNKGEIVESGSYKKLVQKEGKFWEMTKGYQE